MAKNIKNKEESKCSNDKIYINNFNDIYKLNNNYNNNNHEIKDMEIFNSKKYKFSIYNHQLNLDKLIAKQSEPFYVQLLSFQHKYLPALGAFLLRSE